VTSCVGQFFRIDACKAGLLRHGFEVDAEQVRHAPVAENRLTIMRDDPNPFRHGLDDVAISFVSECQISDTIAMIHILSE